MFRSRTGVLSNRLTLGLPLPTSAFSILAAAMYTMVVSFRSVSQCDVLQEQGDLTYGDNSHVSGSRTRCVNGLYVGHRMVPGDSVSDGHVSCEIEQRYVKAVLVDIWTHIRVLVIYVYEIYRLMFHDSEGLS
jgi:hypothetical protein